MINFLDYYGKKKKYVIIYKHNLKQKIIKCMKKYINNNQHNIKNYQYRIKYF
jgi:hypothetical protein